MKEKEDKINGEESFRGKDKEAIIQQLIKKFNVDINKLKNEQLKFAKQLKLKDSIDFELADRIAGCESAFFNNSIVTAIVVLNPEMEIIEQKYFSEKLKFPYLPEFRAYREIPAMVACFNKLEEQPDVIFIDGHGTAHPRLGLASHFSLAIQRPCIGVAKDLLAGEVKGDEIIINGKIVGKLLATKQGSKPIYVSPGNFISLDTSVKLVKKYTKEPHKLPEPLVQASKYAKKIRDEIREIKT